MKSCDTVQELQDPLLDMKKPSQRLKTKVAKENPTKGQEYRQVRLVVVRRGHQPRQRQPRRPPDVVVAIILVNPVENPKSVQNQADGKWSRDQGEQRHLMMNPNHPRPQVLLLQLLHLRQRVLQDHQTVKKRL